MRSIGMGLIATAFILSVFVGLYLAIFVDSNSGIVLVAASSFFIIMPLALYGIYLYIRGEVVDEESVMLKQRELMDILAEYEQLRIDYVASKIYVDSADVRIMINQLIDLQVFSGYVNWNDGILCGMEGEKLKVLTSCLVCEFPINLTDKYKSVCKICETEYFVL